MPSLANCVAFVTGGSSGLGRAAVNRLLNMGSKACFVFDTQAPLYENTWGDKLLSKRGCVTKEEDVKTALRECVTAFGRLDVVLNCAGVGIAFKIINHRKRTTHNLQDVIRLLEINLLGTFNVNRLACEHLEKNEPDEDGLRGLLINTSGLAAINGRSGQAAYAASSAAVNSMTLPIARDVGPWGIRCLTICVGYFDTPVFSSSPEILTEYLANSALSPRRLGKPEDYAHLVQSVIENPYLNATVINLDGGLRLMY